MNAYFKKETNIEVGQKLFGIIASSIYTYDGVYPIVVSDIDWDDDEVVFDIDQPCGQVFCTFEEMSKYVFETEEEANAAKTNLCLDEGLYNY